MAMILSEQIRRVIKESELSRFAIATLSKIDHGAFSRFMVGRGGLSMASLDRLAEVLALKVVAEILEVKGGKKMTTQTGYVSTQGHEVIRRVGRSPSHRNQFTYELRCSHCGTHFGANGCDIEGANAGAGRRCPNPSCQAGTPGDPI